MTHRFKNVQYDADELDYDEDDYEQGGEESYSAEDRERFAALTPVVRAELDEAGLQASDRDIEDSLWNYYWDIGKTVSYVKETSKPKSQKQAKQDKPKPQTKPKSKFEEAAERSAQQADRGLPSWSAVDWFRGVPWSHVPPDMEGDLVPAQPPRPALKLLGGSSKLAKLAEERRKKAAAADSSFSTATGALGSLDRLSKPKDSKENEAPAVATPEPRKYPIRKKRDPSPAPREPTPPPTEPEEEKPDLRASPTAFGRAISCDSAQAQHAPTLTVQDMLGSSTGEQDPFKGPSPDDVVFRAQQHSNTKTKQSVNGASGLTKRTEALKLNGAASSATEPAQSKVRSKGLDVPQLWAEDSKKRKKAAAFVVIGHVDHGKSTLMGRLLLDCGAVTQRDIDKYKKQASEMGKASFALAWVMDTGSEERERGVTVDIAQHHFSTEKTDFTILDAPGHRDFVPNMIGGASMADLAVLVVDANQLESGMKGQTKEHILLAKAAGLEKLIVAVNKLDSTTPAPWSEDVFDNVRNTVTKLLTDTGFSSQDVVTVPCSGLNGDNVAKAPQHNGTPAWVSKYPTLLAVLEGSVLPQPDMQIISGPVRMQIADVFRGGITNPLSVSGRIAAGNAQVGDIVLVQPSGETATVKDIEVNGEPRDFAVAGQISTLHLADVEAQHLRSGDVICSSSHPVVVVKSLTAMIDALDSILPQGVDVHIGRLHVPGAITQLISTVDAQGEQIRRKPRIIKAGQRAQVKVAVDAGIPIGGGERIVLRSAGETIAYGIVEKTTSK